MRRTLFGLWMVGTAAALLLLSLSLFPGSHRALIVSSLFWLLGIAPLSFTLWFRAQRRREEEDVDAALEAWRLAKPGAGQAIAKAIEEALEEEDEVSLARLIKALPADPTFTPFVTAAETWMHDDGGRSSRNDHLDAARELARPVLPVLSAR
jgi:hypothetical protein